MDRRSFIAVSAATPLLATPAVAKETSYTCFLQETRKLFGLDEKTMPLLKVHCDEDGALTPEDVATFNDVAHWGQLEGQSPLAERIGSTWGNFLKTWSKEGCIRTGLALDDDVPLRSIVPDSLFLFDAREIDRQILTHTLLNNMHPEPGLLTFTEGDKRVVIPHDLDVIKLKKRVTHFYAWVEEPRCGKN